MTPKTIPLLWINTSCLSQETLKTFCCSNSVVKYFWHFLPWIQLRVRVAAVWLRLVGSVGFGEEFHQAMFPHGVYSPGCVRCSIWLLGRWCLCSVFLNCWCFVVYLFTFSLFFSQAFIFFLAVPSHFFPCISSPRASVTDSADAHSYLHCSTGQETDQQPPPHLPLSDWVMTGAWAWCHFIHQIMTSTCPAPWWDITVL